MEAVGNLRAEEILEALDNEQRAVALATRGPVCVIAGAGTGKTRAITHRIAYAAAIGTMDPHKVLALTFTARAAGEMRTRLRSLGVPAVAARTIHAAALKQLTFFWPQVFGGRTPDLLTTKSGFLTEAIKRAQLQGELSITSRDLLRDIATEIEWAKVSQISPSDYLSESLKRTVKPRINPEQLAKVYTAYESVKHQERAIDFEDVLLLTTAMIEEEREVRERVQDQYRFFTVDEYQDISPLQQRLINAWLGSRQELCVVGDPAQTIYSFAGATPVFLNSFTQRFPEAEVVRLTTGYRSTPEIIFTANSILRKGSMGNELVAINEHGSKPTITAYNDEQAEIAGIVRDISQLISEGTPAQEIAVLARTNNQLNGLEKALNSAGLPYQVRNTERFFERKEVRDFLKLFDVVEDWPIQVAIAREYPALRVQLIDNVLVYYRRTNQSIYLVANERFLQDKERVYDDLIRAENGITEKLRLLSRKKALRRKASMVSRLMNIDTYFFIVSALANALPIYRRTKNHSIDLIRHRDHYMRIRQSAKCAASRV